RLVDQAGNPLAGRSVLASYAGNVSNLAWDYVTASFAAGASAHNAVRLVLPEDPRDQSLLLQLIARFAATDAEGRFELPLPPLDLQRLMLLQGPKGATTFVATMRVSWTGKPVDDLLFRAQ